jgi:hypothetical protein
MLTRVSSTSCVFSKRLSLFSYSVCCSLLYPSRRKNCLVFYSYFAYIYLCTFSVLSELDEGSNRIVEFLSNLDETNASLDSYTTS